MKQETQEEQKEQELKQIWHYAEPVLINKIILETAKNNKEDIRRIRFEADDVVITFKPQKTKTEIKTKKDFEIVSDVKDIYSFSDLEDEFPELLEIAKNCKKEPQTIIISFVEKEFYNEREDEINTYFFMNQSQMNTLYYKPVHKDNKERIQKQEETKKRYEEKEL